MVRTIIGGETLDILHVIPYFGGNMGGEYSACKAMAEAQRNGGHNVTILTSKWPIDDEIPDKQLIRFNTPFRFSNFTYTPTMKRWLMENGSRFDVIHLHTFRSYQNALVCKMRKKVGKPIVIQAHGSVPRSIGNRGMKRLFDLLYLPSILRSVDLAFALSESERDDYISIGFRKEKIAIIPNGIPLDQYGENLIPHEFRTKFGFEKQKPLIMFIGRLDRIKGPDILIAAFADLTKRGIDASLAIVGPGIDQIESLNKMIVDLGVQDSVKITGALYGRDKFSAYADADIVVIPSRYETFPVVLLEALSIGKPVILSDRCSVAEEFKRYCTITPPEMEAISNAIATILIDLDGYSDRALKAKAEIVDTYDINKVSKRIVTIYEFVSRGENFDAGHN